MTSPPDPLPYELRVGVTGHRNLSNPQAIAAAVDRLLDQIQDTFESAAESPSGPAKYCGPLQWLVISPLAKGSDQIVASRVLARPQANGRPRLQVIAPFPLEEYRRDFTDAHDLREFERLLSFDPQCLVLHPDYQCQIAGFAPEKAHAARNDAYLAAGHQVVDSCEILIAVWNGEQAAGPGGTGDVVRYAIGRGQPVLWIDSIHPDRPARLLARDVQLSQFGLADLIDDG